MSRYNIFDLLSPQSRDYLRKILAKYDIHVDEKQLYESGLNKQTLISQVLKNLDLVPNKYELTRKEAGSALGPDHEDQKKSIETKALDDEDFRKRKFSCVIKTLFNLSLIEETMSMFVRNEKLKELEMEYRKLLEKAEESEYAFQVNIAEQERAKMEETLRAMLAAELDRQLKESEDRMNDSRNHIERLNKDMEALKQQKINIISIAAKEISSDLKSYATSDNVNHFQNIPEDKLEAFSKDCFKANCDFEKRLKVLDKEEKAIIGNQSSGFPLPAFGKQPDPNDPRIQNIQQERRDIKHEQLQNVKDNAKKHGLHSLANASDKTIMEVHERIKKTGEPRMKEILNIDKKILEKSAEKAVHVEVYKTEKVKKDKIVDQKEETKLDIDKATDKRRRKSCSAR